MRTLRVLPVSAIIGAAAFVAGAGLAGATSLAPQSSVGGAAAISLRAIAAIVPGRSTKASLRAAFGQPWRVAQFNDCGIPM